MWGGEEETGGWGSLIPENLWVLPGTGNTTDTETDPAALRISKWKRKWKSCQRERLKKNAMS